MTLSRNGAPEPSEAPDPMPGSESGEQPVLTRAARRKARDGADTDIALPRVANLPRYLTVVAAIVASVLIAVSAGAGEEILAAALLLGALIIAWGWPGAVGLPSPKGASIVLALSAIALTGAVLVAGSAPYLRWGSGALALGLILVFLHQLLRRDGRPRLTESVMRTTLGLVVLASGAAFLPLIHVVDGPALIACAMAAVGVGTLVDLFVRHDTLRPWLLPLGMVIGGAASVGTAYLISAPDLPPAALIGVCSAALSHAFRRMLAPEVGSYSGPGQIATGLASVELVGALVWALNQFVMR